jgi:hypothetical protein
VSIESFLVYACDAGQGIDALVDFAKPQGHLTKKLLGLRVLLLRPLPLLPLSLQQHLDRLCQSFVALRQPVQPLIKSHYSIVENLPSPCFGAGRIELADGCGGAFRGTNSYG